MTHRIALLLFLAMLFPATANAEIVPNPDPDLVAEWQPCEPGTGVTVIVDRFARLGDGKVYVRCALGEQPNGVAALQNAGFEPEGTLQYGLAFICRIDGQPTAAEESCQMTPGGQSYWSFWNGVPGGAWNYSGAGAISPQSAGKIDTVQGWAFGGRPRLDPMHGSGPSSFTMPPAQESSVVPAILAREWLAETTLRHVALAGEAKAAADTERLLSQVGVLVRAGVDPADLQPFVARLGQSCEKSGVPTSACVLRGLADPDAALNSKFAVRFAVAVLGLWALGQDPSDFEGLDMRAALLDLVDEATGQVRSQGSLKATIAFLFPTVEALARTGPLPAKTLLTVDLLLGLQNATTGLFGAATIPHVNAMRALIAARDASGVEGLGEERFDAVTAAIAAAGDYLETVQEPDGSVKRQTTGNPTAMAPNLESTAAGAVGLALTGHSAAAERAAKWVSRHQITAEYAGSADPNSGEPAPAEDDVGAFLANEAALKNALLTGVADNANGPNYSAQEPTSQALDALIAAGPYGPYFADLDQTSFFFEEQTAGSQSVARAATLSNRDLRAVTVESATVVGDDAAEFILDASACAGLTLQPDQSCELAIRFAPAAAGFRQATARLELAGTEQAVELLLTGTALPPPTHQVSVTTTGLGTVSADSGAISGCSTSPPAGTCAGSYEEGSTVTLTATPGAEQRFAEWAGTDADACTDAAVCELEVGAADAALEAAFEPIPPPPDPVVEVDQTIAAGAAWLRAQQVQSGAIGGFNGDWATTTLAAAGVNAADVRGVGTLRSLQDQSALELGEPEWGELPSMLGPGLLGKAALIAHSAGLQPTRIAADVNLAASLAATYDWSDGSFGDTRSTNGLGFALLAMPHLGFPAAIVERAVETLLANQHSDGGWTFGEGGGSAPGDTDMTGAALAMICSNGIGSDHPQVQAGIEFLHDLLDPATGAIESALPFVPAQNAPTHAWALTGIQACGEDPLGPEWTTAQNKTPIDFALSLRVTAGGQTGAILYEPGTTPTDPRNLNATETLVRALTGSLFSADPPARENPAQPAVRPAPSVADGTTVPVALTIDDDASAVRMCAVRVPSGTPLVQVLKTARTGSVPAGCVADLGTEGSWVTSINGVAAAKPTGGWVVSTPGGEEQRAGEGPVRFGDVLRLRLVHDGLPEIPAGEDPAQPDPENPTPDAAPGEEARSTVTPIAPADGPRRVGRGRLVTLATVACPGTSTCQLGTPRAVAVKIAGKRYRAAVLAPGSLAAGETAAVQLKLTRRALQALAEDPGTAVVKVTVQGSTGAVTHTVRLRIRSGGSQPSSRPAASPSR